ncbi:MAG: GFA family protein [Myxococcota bacterium]|nr:GFA family protein [Myxococcota bacterium]
MITGNCLCGDVRYEIEGRISSIWLCHCSKCRRATGSAFHASAVCDGDRFRFCSGEDGIREYEDTPGYVAAFCERCGSPVPRQLRGTEFVFLHVGQLDGDPERSVDHHIFTGSKAPWFEICDGKPQFDEHKPRPE